MENNEGTIAKSNKTRKKKKKSRNKFMCQEPIGSTKSKNKT